MSWKHRGSLALVTLAGTHLVIDAYSSSYAPLLAALRARLDLTLAQVGGCAAALAFSASLLQPLYGFLSDRLRSRFQIALAPAITALGLAALSWSDSYLSALLLFAAAGIGIAAFHPQGAAQAREATSRRPGLMMSLFFGGGNIGYALGPLLAGLALAWWGWPGLWRIAIPGMAATLVLLWLAPEPQRRRHRSTGAVPALRRHSKPLLLLYMLVVVRGSVQVIFVGFLPLYFIDLGYGLGGSSRSLSAFLAAGAFGGLCGGLLNDRLGSRAVIRLSMAGSLPFLAGAFLLPAAWQPVALSTGYFILLMSLPVNLLMAQDWVPEYRGTVSSLMMGFAWGMGGVMAPLVGRLADLYGLSRALLLVAMLPLAGICLAWRLPEGPSEKAASLQARSRLLPETASAAPELHRDRPPPG
ncbi:MAG: MFS transporter [Acidobacteriota bacterium]